MKTPWYKPWHLWLIGLLALLWNAGGAYDYLMIKTENAAYLAQLNPEQFAYLQAFPTWVGVAWALGVWGGLAGAALLLIKSRLAVGAFAVSLVGMAGNLTYGLVLSDIPMVEVTGNMAAVFTLAILLVAIFLWAYAARMRKAGILS